MRDNSDTGPAGGPDIRAGRLRLLVLLLLLFCLLRGLNLSLLQMPFEGWDEYQHLAVAEYLHEHGAAPEYGERVPASLFDFLRRHPHPDDGARQLAAIGAQNYAGRYWDPAGGEWREAPSEAPAVRMYQAQQGPLYYQLLAVLRGAIAEDDPELWLDAGRAINVLFAVAALALWAGILHRFLGEPRSWLLMITCAMVATNSLYAYNYAHVANDALAIALFSLCVFIYSGMPGTSVRRLIALAVLLGALTGLAVLAKATALILVPFVYVMLTWRGWRERSIVYGLAIAAFSLAYLVIAGGYHADSIDKYGSITGMQEALVNRRSGKDYMDIIAALGDIGVGDIRRTFITGLLHEGGWSFVAPDAVSYRSYQALAGLAVLGMIASVFMPEYRKRLRAQLGRLSPLLLLLGLTWAAMMYHGLQTVVAWGNMLTRPPYVMAVFPMVCMVLLGLGAFGKRVTVLLGMAYCLVFSAAYYSGTYRLLELYRPAGTPGEKLDYVLSHHSLLFQLYPLRYAVALEGLLLAALLVLLARYCGLNLNSATQGGPRSAATGR